MLLITVVSGWFGLSGGNKFFSWQNLMNSLAQAIVIVGLLAIGETVVIIAGALDISVGSIASIGSVVAASVLVGVGIGARQLHAHSATCSSRCWPGSSPVRWRAWSTA